jgi:hypothetical protein
VDGIPRLDKEPAEPYPIPMIWNEWSMTVPACDMMTDCLTTDMRLRKLSGG